MPSLQLAAFYVYKGLYANQDVLRHDNLDIQIFHLFKSTKVYG